MTAAIIVGDPRPHSLALRSAAVVVELITGRRPDVEVDLARLGIGLFDAGDQQLSRLVAELTETTLVVVAGPVICGSYSGLLKLFLDHIPTGALARTTAIPLLIGRNPRHALAGDAFLRPVLTELGAATPSAALFLLESDATDEAVIQEWIGRERHRLPTRLDLLAVSRAPSIAR